MEFRVLGPLEVVDRGRRLALGTAKQQALLAVLVLHANEVVSRARLVDELWGERPPVTADKAVQVYVSQLRKALAANGSAIATRGDGYVLEVAPECVDATRFERLVAEGQALTRAGEHEEAVRSLREALGLWRGRPLAGLTFEWHTRAEVEHLEELRWGALMDRLDCELLLGRHDQTIAELELLVAQNPLQERLRGQLMLALYRSGRQADALAVYREGRKTLVEELGLEPSADLQRLERAILTQDPALERASTFGPVRVVHGGSTRVQASRRLLVIAGGVTAVALGAGAAIALVAGRDEARGPASVPARLAPDSLGVVDPSSARVVAAIPVGGAPLAVAVRERDVWVGNQADQTVVRVDARSRRIVRSFGLGASPTAIAAGAGTVWVANGFRGVLSRIQVGTNELLPPLRPNEGAAGRLVLAADGTGVWVGSQDDTVFRLNREGHVGAVVPFDDPRGVAVGAGAVWVIGYRTNDVARIDPRRGRIVARVRIGELPRAIVFGEGAVWVATGADRRLWRVDPRTNAVTATIPLSGDPSAVAAGDGAVWVADGPGGTISRVDTATNRVVRTVKVAELIGGVAAGPAGIWVAAR